MNLHTRYKIRDAVFPLLLKADQYIEHGNLEAALAMLQRAAEAVETFIKERTKKT